MPIPKQFIEKYLKKAKGCKLFGVEIEDLTKEELIACTIAGWEKEAETRKELLFFQKQLRK